MRCVVSCGSTSFPWLLFFFGALLWGSMIHKHTGRWMWQGSASVVSWSWEKYSVNPNWFRPCQCCCCLCYPGEYLRLGTLISYNWAQVFEACDYLKLFLLLYKWQLFKMCSRQERTYLQCDVELQEHGVLRCIWMYPFAYNWAKCCQCVLERCCRNYSSCIAWLVGVCCVCHCA